MNKEEREQAAHVISKVSWAQFQEFFETEAGATLKEHLDAVQGALYSIGPKAIGAPHKPTYELLDLLGHRLLSDRSLGPGIREMLIRILPPSKWRKLRDEYLRLGKDLHGNYSQKGEGSKVLAGYWRRGGVWAETFCELTALPMVFAGRREKSLHKDEDVLPAKPLPQLHYFQEPVYAELRRLINSGRGKSALLSLPTGAGKTRVAVEAICDHLAASAVTGAQRRNLVLWIARSQELQEQAWECFRQVWQVAPQRANGEIERIHPLRIVQLWGGADPSRVEIGEEPTVFIAGAQQLRSWARAGAEFITAFPRKRLVCVAIDEAQSTITNEFRLLLCALRLRKAKVWTIPNDAPLVIGLTATPWRSNDDESKRLRGYFNYNLLKPGVLEDRPIATLQKQRILARVAAQRLDLPLTTPMYEDERIELFETKRVPSRYLHRLGQDVARNAKIVKLLYNLPDIRKRVLVFSCSIEHAGTLALALNRAFDEQVAVVLTNQTPRAERADISEAFRRDAGPRFLCNVDLLATGFDAPRVDTVCITRPTASSLRYEQMVGRGLRGPENGGTDECLVLDVQDKGLPDTIMSYARVAALWDVKSDIVTA